MIWIVTLIVGVLSIGLALGWFTELFKERRQDRALWEHHPSEPPAPSDGGEVPA